MQQKPDLLKLDRAALPTSELPPVQWRGTLPAGIELRQKSSKKKTINYNKEIAFEKRPAMGFYDTGEEGDRTKEMREQFRPQTLEELEGRRRQVGLFQSWRQEAGCSCKRCSWLPL